jgi:hypothetical protein
VAALWGFTVDDALIAPRVAWRLVSGHVYRFNGSGPAVDAVTPLGWAFLLVPWAGEGTLAAWTAARWLGAACWVVAAGWLGFLVWREGRRWVRFLPLALLAACPSFGAWAGSGMETGTVSLFGTAALGRSRLAPIAAGLAAAWRPEMIPWALVLAGGLALVETRRPARVAWALGCAVGPALVVAVLRSLLFDRAAPLAVLAKPSDLEHGLNYALRALVWTGPPLLLVAPRAVARLGGRHRVILAAFGAHVVAVVLAGGDWMALFRLFVPVLPGVLLVGSAIADCAAVWSTLARCAVALGACGFVGLNTGMPARTVVASRTELISQAARELQHCRRIAALDVGWVGAATDADIVDLAGVTDPTVAVLPGGHTSKRIPASWIAAREVDAVVLLLAPGRALVEPWILSGFERVVERRVARLCADVGFRPVAQLTRMKDGRAYVVVKLDRITGAPRWAVLDCKVARP